MRFDSVSRVFFVQGCDGLQGGRALLAVGCDDGTLTLYAVPRPSAAVPSSIPCDGLGSEQVLVDSKLCARNVFCLGYTYTTEDAGRCTPVLGIAVSGELTS